MTRRPGDHRVLNPGMDETVPQHVDETDQLGVFSCHNPAEAMLIHEFLPVPLRPIVDRSLECFGVKLVQLPVIEVTAPRGGDRHLVTLVDLVPPPDVSPMARTTFGPPPLPIPIK